jgi:peptide subunit release factor 1 (eRF1)
MNRHTEETVGFRYTGWAALSRDPQDDRVEFVCPHCGERGEKSAHRERAEYHFTDGFVQDTQGEATTCKKCKTQLHVAPVVLLHDQDEKRRFQAVFVDSMGPSSN